MIQQETLVQAQNQWTEIKALGSVRTKNNYMCVSSKVTSGEKKGVTKTF